MSWTDECQMLGYWEYTENEWRDWIESLPEEGFGRYTKQGWKFGHYTKQGWTDWLERMISKHGRGETPPSDNSIFRACVWVPVKAPPSEPPLPTSGSGDGLKAPPSEPPLPTSGSGDGLKAPPSEPPLPASGSGEGRVPGYTLHVTASKWVPKKAPPAQPPLKRKYQFEPDTIGS